MPDADRGLARSAIEAARAIEGSRAQRSELEAEAALLQDDVTRLREHLGTLAKREAGSAQDQVVQRILERDEQLRALEAKTRALEGELARKEEALGALWSPAQSPR